MNDGPLSATEKTLIVLEAALQHTRYTDVVEATGLSRTSVHRIVRALAAHRFLTVTSDGRYYPGPKVLALAGAAFERIDIGPMAEPVIDWLVAQTQCTIHIGVLNGREAIYVARRDSTKPYRMPSRVGLTLQLHSTAIGKVMMADFGPDQVQQYIEGAGLMPRTPRTITDPHRFERELAGVRRRGYAIDDQENEPGIRCVAAGIQDQTGRTDYAISVSTLALEHSLPKLRTMAPLVVEAAGRISDLLGRH